MESGADIVFMADDLEFVAVNMRERRCADNTHSTALGYSSGLKRAMGGVMERKCWSSGREGWQRPRKLLA